MIKLPNYQRLLADVIKRIRPDASFKFRRGDIVGFVFSPRTGDGASVSDLFVLLLVVEMKSFGQGEGLWGCNLFDIPGTVNKDRLGQALKKDSAARMTLAAELHKSTVTRPAFKYYHKDGIKLPIIKFDEEQLRKIL